MKCCARTSRCSSARCSMLLRVLLANAWTLRTCGLLLPVDTYDSVPEDASQTQDVQHLEPAEDFSELETPLGVTPLEKQPVDNVKTPPAVKDVPLEEGESFDQYLEKTLKVEKPSSTQTKPLEVATDLQGEEGVKTIEKALNQYLEKPQQVKQQQQQLQQKQQQQRQQQQHQHQHQDQHQHQWQDKPKSSINHLSAPEQQVSAQVHEEVKAFAHLIKQEQQVQQPIPGATSLARISRTRRGAQQVREQHQKQKQVETLKVKSHAVKQSAKNMRTATQAGQQTEIDVALLTRYYPYKSKLEEAILTMFNDGGAARLKAAGNTAKARGFQGLQLWLDDFIRAQVPDGGALLAAQRNIFVEAAPFAPPPKQQATSTPTHADWQAEVDASILKHTFGRSQDALQGALGLMLESGGLDRIKAAEKMGKAKGYSRAWQEQLKVFEQRGSNGMSEKKQKVEQHIQKASKVLKTKGRPDQKNFELQQAQTDAQALAISYRKSDKEALEVKLVEMYDHGGAKRVKAAQDYLNALGYDTQKVQRLAAGQSA